MAATSQVILIFGSGPNVGQHVARAFAAKGYKIALVSRNPKEQDSANQVNIASDLSDPDAVIDAFTKVKSLLGLPSVVVYNAAAATQNEPKHPLSLSLTDFTRDLNVNTVSAFAAAQQAAAAFEQLPDTASRTFIYTGNILNTITMAPLLDLGVGKSATAHVIQSAASAYADRGFKFYYGDERNDDGSPAYAKIDGEAHGEFYSQLSEHKLQGPWLQTFVKGSGYKKF
ncbi:putative short-chain dehydrogenase [Polychaeton citri CBS 116435]|uniref:Short-chain dehydrogenase n=1 Tax=Polychaeton citri CBS 116435 TaxID=1314669 RepID=A0A9P4ULU4_9PEZI|nr:putative short-chain dehydrogenase [Polychaeton citri CBS 116435]